MIRGRGYQGSTISKARVPPQSERPILTLFGFGLPHLVPGDPMILCEADSCSIRCDVRSGSFQILPSSTARGEFETDIAPQLAWPVRGGDEGWFQLLCFRGEASPLPSFPLTYLKEGLFKSNMFFL